MNDDRHWPYPADVTTTWFQEPLRDPMDLDGKVSFAQPGPRGIVRTDRHRGEREDR